MSQYIIGVINQASAQDSCALSSVDFSFGRSSKPANCMAPHPDHLVSLLDRTVEETGEGLEVYKLHEVLLPYPSNISIDEHRR